MNASAASSRMTGFAWLTRDSNPTHLINDTRLLADCLGILAFHACEGGGEDDPAEALAMLPGLTPATVVNGKESTQLRTLTLSRVSEAMAGAMGSVLHRRIELKPGASALMTTVLHALSGVHGGTIAVRLTILDTVDVDAPSLGLLTCLASAVVLPPPGPLGRSVIQLTLESSWSAYSLSSANRSALGSFVDEMERDQRLIALGDLSQLIVLKDAGPTCAA